MPEPHLAKLLDWFAKMSLRLERMDGALREVLEGQAETRELLAHLQSDLRVVKTAVAHNSEGIQRHETVMGDERPAVLG